MATEDKELTKLQKKLGVPPIIISFFLVAWVILAGVYAWGATAWLAQRGWVEARAKIVSVTLREAPRVVVSNRCGNKTDNEERLLVVVTYRFDVDGKSYTSDQYDHEYRGDYECDRPDAEERAKDFRVNGDLNVHYDPGDPRRSVIRPVDTAETYVFGTLLGIALLCILAFLLRQWLRYAAAGLAPLTGNRR